MASRCFVPDRIARVRGIGQEIVRVIVSATAAEIVQAIAPAQGTGPKAVVTAPRAPAIVPKVAATAPRAVAIVRRQPIAPAGPRPTAVVEGATTHSEACRQGALPIWHLRAAR